MENTNYNCDIETGVCSPNTSEQTAIEIQEKENHQKLKITYYYDALCGWCYGFTDAFKEFKEAHKEDIDFEVVSGGLFLGARVGKINDVAPYIKQGAYKSVEQTTGVLFGKPFLDKVLGEGNILLDSLPPAIALSVIKEHHPEKSVEFAELLLLAGFKEGIDLTNFKEYEPYVAKIGFDVALFNTLVTQEAAKNAALKDFASFAEKQLGGMPTLLIEHKNKKGVLSNGYTNYNELEKRLEYFINQQ